MPVVMCIYLIQIYTFLLFNVLKREVSIIFLYIWTKNYSHSYSYSGSTSLMTLEDIDGARANQPQSISASIDFSEFNMCRLRVKVWQ